MVMYALAEIVDCRANMKAEFLNAVNNF